MSEARVGRPIGIGTNRHNGIRFLESSLGKSLKLCNVATMSILCARLMSSLLRPTCSRAGISPGENSDSTLYAQGGDSCYCTSWTPLSLGRSEKIQPHLPPMEDDMEHHIRILHCQTHDNDTYSSCESASSVTIW